MVIVIIVGDYIMVNKKPLTDEMVWDLLINYDVVEYIKKKCPSLFTTEKLIRYANNLKNVRKFTDEEILNGKADFDIDIIIKAEEAAYKAIQAKDKEKVYLPIKPKKEKVSPLFLKRLLLGTLAGATIITCATFISKSQEREETNLEVSEYIGMLASKKGTDDYLNKRNIVAQNTYNRNHYVIYNLPNIALDILKVASDDPDIFDLCILSAYFNMDYNRLKNMDEIINHLRINAIASASPLQEKMSACSNFLDYALKISVARGLFEENSSEYQKIYNAVQVYKLNDYDDLEEDDKKIILAFLNKMNTLLEDLGIEQLPNLQERLANKDLDAYNLDSKERGK